MKPAYHPTTAPKEPEKFGSKGFVYMALSECGNWVKVGISKSKVRSSLNGYGGLKWTQMASIKHRDNRWIERHVKYQFEDNGPPQRLMGTHTEAFMVSYSEMVDTLQCALKDYVKQYKERFGFYPSSMPDSPEEIPVKLPLDLRPDVYAVRNPSYPRTALAAWMSMAQFGRNKTAKYARVAENTTGSAMLGPISGPVAAKLSVAVGLPADVIEAGEVRIEWAFMLDEQGHAVVTKDTP